MWFPTRWSSHALEALRKLMQTIDADVKLRLKIEQFIIFTSIGILCANVDGCFFAWIGVFLQLRYNVCTTLFVMLCDLGLLRWQASLTASSHSSAAEHSAWQHCDGLAASWPSCHKQQALFPKHTLSHHPVLCAACFGVRKVWKQHDKAKSRRNTGFYFCRSLQQTQPHGQQSFLHLTRWKDPRQLALHRHIFPGSAKCHIADATSCSFVWFSLHLLKTTWVEKTFLLEKNSSTEPAV